MAKLRIPDGRRLFGTNIIPTQADVAPAAGQLAWSNLFLNWDARWPVWIKPQVDYLCGNGIGANCIRMIGGLDGVAAGLYSQSYHDDKLEQLVSYVDSLGVHFMLCGSGTQNQLLTAISGGLTARQYGAMQAATIRRMQRYSNVIGCDLIQESQGGSIGNTFLIPMIREARDLGATIPLTCSASVVNTALNTPVPGPRGEDWLLGISQGPILPSFDFISIHCYFRAIDATFWDQFFAAAPDYDVIIGEFGRALSAGAATPPDTGSRALQVSDYARWMVMGSAPDPRVRGALSWAASDQRTDDNTERWGSYDENFVPRSWMLDTLKQFTFGSVAKNNAARR
jgi:hypothetical protein